MKMFFIQSTSQTSSGKVDVKIYSENRSRRQKKEEKEIADICKITVSLYVKAWFRASSITSAPRNDL